MSKKGLAIFILSLFLLASPIIAATEVSWLEAHEAIKEAETATIALKGLVDLDEANSLLKEAEDYFEASNWARALEKAEQAKRSALTAQPIDRTDPGDTFESQDVVLEILGIGFVIFVVIAGYIWVQIKKPKKKKPRVKKACEICGVHVGKEGYTCDYCGKKVCYEHVRKYRGRNVCTKCAKRKGLI